MPTTFLLGCSDYCFLARLPHVAHDLCPYVLSHTHCLKSLRLIAGRCFFAAICCLRWIHRWFGMQTPRGAGGIILYMYIILHIYTYIHVCLCAHFPLPPHWLLPFTLLFWAKLRREFEVSTDFVSFSFTTGCFSQEVCNTLNPDGKTKSDLSLNKERKPDFLPKIWEHWLEN